MPKAMPRSSDCSAMRGRATRRATASIARSTRSRRASARARSRAASSAPNAQPPRGASNNRAGTAPGPFPSAAAARSGRTGLERFEEQLVAVAVRRRAHEVIYMSVAGGDVAAIEPRIIDALQPLKGALGRYRQVALVELARDKRYRQPQMFRTQVARRLGRAVAALVLRRAEVELRRRAAPDDLRQMAKRGHVAGAELLAQAIVGRGGEPFVAIEMAVHEGDAVADRAVAFVIGEIDHGSEESLENRMARVFARRKIVDPEIGEYVAQVQHAFDLGRRRHRVVQGNLRARDASHLRQITRRQRHEERARAGAVDHRLNRFRAGALADEGEGGGKIVFRRLVQVELAKRQADARAPVEQPHVIPVIHQVLREMLLDRRQQEHPAPHARAVHDHHRALVAAAIAREPDLDAVGGRGGIVLYLRQSHRESPPARNRCAGRARRYCASRGRTNTSHSVPMNIRPNCASACVLRAGSSVPDTANVPSWCMKSAIRMCRMPLASTSPERSWPARITVYSVEVAPQTSKRPSSRTSLNPSSR